MDDSFSALASDPALWNLSIFTLERNLGLAWMKLRYLHKTCLAHSNTELKPHYYYLPLHQVLLAFLWHHQLQDVPAKTQSDKHLKMQWNQLIFKYIQIKTINPEQNWSLCYLPFCQLFHLGQGHLGHHEDPEFKEGNT